MPVGAQGERVPQPPQGSVPLVHGSPPDPSASAYAPLPSAEPTPPGPSAPDPPAPVPAQPAPHTPAPPTPGPRWWAWGRDVLTEALSLGRAPTATFNRDDLAREYQHMREMASALYDREAELARERGEVLAISKQEFLSRLPTQDEFVHQALAQSPSLGHLAREWALASIPVYGTVRTWQDSPGWARGLSLAGDVLTFVPILGQAGALARMGVGAGRASLILGRSLALSALPIPTGNPLRTLDPVVDILHPTRVPIEPLTVSYATQRIPALAVSSYPHLLEGAPVGPGRGMALRDVLTRKAIAGVGGEAVVQGVEAHMRTPLAQKILGPTAFHATPDIRPFLEGTEIAGEGLYVAPSFLPRFAEATSLGLRPPEGVQGGLLIRDPEVLERLTPSRKLYRGTAEIEAVVAPGTHLPAPSQLLQVREPLSGRLYTVAVVGTPLTLGERAVLKALGVPEAVRSILDPSQGWVRHVRQGEHGGVLPTQPRRVFPGADYGGYTGRAGVGDGVGVGGRRLPPVPGVGYRGGEVSLPLAHDTPLRGAPFPSGEGRVPPIPSGVHRPQGRQPPPSAPVERRTPPPPPALAEVRHPPPPPPALAEVRHPPPPPPAEGRRSPLPPPSGGRTPPPPPPQPYTPTFPRVPAPPSGGRTPPPATTGLPPLPSPPPPPFGGPPMPQPQVVSPTLAEHGLAWRQGEVWVAVYPPFTAQDVEYAPERPHDAIPVASPKEAWRRIRRMGYTVPKDALPLWSYWFASRERG